MPNRILRTTAHKAADGANPAGHATLRTALAEASGVNTRLLRRQDVDVGLPA
ncbi:MAG: hypothetical protein AAGK78_12205 [Planctomycetota bacterium]